MNTSPTLTRIELLESDDLSRYLIHREREIKFILRQLRDARALIQAYAKESSHSFLTAILDLDEDDDRLLLDISPDQSLNARLTTGQTLDCVTQLDKVRIQFRVSGVQISERQDGQVFVAALPDKLLRLQRREFYRLQTPPTHTLKCIVPLEDEQEAVLRILDISGGGIAVAVPPDDLPFTPGCEYPDCRIVLPDSLPVSARLIVRNLFRLTTRNGTEVLRAGCEFADMPRGAEEAIQRYIFKVERDRSARQQALD
ncbi:MAG: flagellar brake protein [Thauera sp.]|nr:flagellar brake protein [Thauera sp.]